MSLASSDNPFASLRAWTETPYRLARPVSVSPGRTTWLWPATRFEAAGYAIAPLVRTETSGADTRSRCPDRTLLLFPSLFQTCSWCWVTP